LGSTAAIPLTCVLTDACKGLLRLTGAPAELRAAASKTKAYGSVRFKIRPGATKTVKVHLNAAGKKTVRRQSRVILVATAKVGATVVSANVELTRP
jgi:hypothetical protein